LLSQTQKINTQAEEVIVQNSYDELGKLIRKGIGGTTTQARLQNIDYTYNIQGWLKGINDVNNLGTDLFGFKLNYNTKEIGSTNALQYNGNISETIWRTANDVSTNKTRAYAYQYDALSRITGADYGIKTTTSFNLASGFDMGVGLYDKNGNIKTLWRDNMANTKIDQLSYTYTNAEVSNKLLKVEDSSGSPEGFKNGDNLATEYTYDGNGNLKVDLNKGITSISYNYLNLPKEIVFAPNKKIEYFYDAVGTKQKKKVTNGAVITTTDYAGKSIYQNNALQFISQPEGYIELDGQGGYDYTYQYKDHLGNIRLSYWDTDGDGKLDQTDIKEENNYYPFGLKHSGYNELVSSTNLALKYKYNGKELQDDLIGNSKLDWYDYGARFYDAALGRWHVVDPMAEKYTGLTPYDFVAGNPINIVDPDGMDWFRNDSTGAVLWVDNQDETYSSDGLEYNNIGQYFGMKLGSNYYFFNQQNISIFNNNDITTFNGFGGDRFQMWDAYILGFSSMYNADPDYIKSIMIQESGCCADAWRNDPMTMFNPGDYDTAKNIGTLSEVTTRNNEMNSGLQYRNGIFSINSGIQWLYGAKRIQANNQTLFPSQSATLPVNPWMQPELWRMAWRYNGSSSVLQDSGYQRRFVYAQRVYHRYSNGATDNVPTGTAGYNNTRGY
jgi:RHS repeat-associated protein